MSHDDHAQSTKPAMAAKGLGKAKIVTAPTTSQHGEFQHVSFKTMASHMMLESYNICPCYFSLRISMNYTENVTELVAHA